MNEETVTFLAYLSLFFCELLKNIYLPISEQLDDKYFLKLSKSLGKDWKDLAVFLGFSWGEIQCFKSDNKDSLKDQTFDMLVKWSQKQGDPQTLRDALQEIGREDLASAVPGYNMFLARFLSSTSRKSPEALSYPLYPSKILIK